MFNGERPSCLRGCSGRVHRHGSLLSLCPPLGRGEFRGTAFPCLECGLTISVLPVDRPPLPNERFAQGSRQVRPIDPHLDLERFFYAQLLRVVRKDGTVRLENQLYEVDLALRGLEVRLRFDLSIFARVEVDYRGQSFGLARRVDRQLKTVKSVEAITMKSESDLRPLAHQWGASQVPFKSWPAVGCVPWRNGSLIRRA
jgi:hypothetical protein